MERPTLDPSKPAIPAEWLTVRVTDHPIPEGSGRLSFALKTSRRLFPDATEEQLLEGYLKRLDLVRSIAEPGDEIWAFDSPDDTWASMRGRAGYALVRDGVPLAATAVAMN